MQLRTRKPSSASCCSDRCAVELLCCNCNTRCTLLRNRVLNLSKVLATGQARIPLSLHKAASYCEQAQAKPYNVLLQSLEFAHRSTPAPQQLMLQHSTATTPDYMVCYMAALRMDEFIVDMHDGLLPYGSTLPASLPKRRGKHLQAYVVHAAYPANYMTQLLFILAQHGLARPTLHIGCT